MTFDTLTDVYNSKNLLQPGLKKALNENYFQNVQNVLNASKKYIKSLKVSQEEKGLRILKRKRKAEYLGFVIDIESLIALFTLFCTGVNKILNFLPTYKFSQDHIEIFFGLFQMHLGWNNNPASRQLQTA